jgi:type IV secretory pathway TrbL component
MLMDRSVGITQMFNWGNNFLYWIAHTLIILSFFLVALHLMMTIIEYHMAVLVGAVLIPWGVLQPTAFFSEFSIGWLTGGLVRVLVTGAIVGIAVPLFAMLQLTTTPGGDPSFYSAIIMGLTSLVFAILAWLIPGRAAAIAGRGVSLALHGGALIAGAAGGMRGVIAVYGAIRGVSSLLARR